MHPPGRPPFADHGERRAGLRARLDEVVAVEALAADGDEGLARLQRCGCRSRCRRSLAGGAPSSRPPAAAANASVRPERAHVPLRRLPAPARASSWSEKGSTLSPIVWPVSWPLPAMSRMSPAGSPAMAARIASRRSPISSAPGAPAQHRLADRRRVLAARIVVGDDEPVGVGRGRLAHQRALARDRDRRPRRTRRSSLPSACGRSAFSALASASGVCA